MGVYVKSKKLLLAFSLGLLFAFSISAHALGITSSASENGMVWQKNDSGVQVHRNVINVITGRFENRWIAITYRGKLLRSDSSKIFVYMNLNGRQTQSYGRIQALPMKCMRADYSRLDPDGILSCSFGAADSMLGEAHFPELLANALGSEDWNLELAFVDQFGNWDKAGNENYKFHFDAAREASRPTEYFNFGSSLSYQADTDSLKITYVPGALDIESHLTTGIVMGAKIEGREIQSTALSYNAQTRTFEGNLKLSEIEDGHLEVWFFDSKGNYDSNFGKNVSFTLRRK